MSPRTWRDRQDTTRPPWDPSLAHPRPPRREQLRRSHRRSRWSAIRFRTRLELDDTTSWQIPSGRLAHERCCERSTVVTIAAHWTILKVQIEHLRFQNRPQSNYEVLIQPMPHFKQTVDEFSSHGCRQLHRDVVAQLLVVLRCSKRALSNHPTIPFSRRGNTDLHRWRKSTCRSISVAISSAIPMLSLSRFSRFAGALVIVRCSALPHPSR